MIDSDEELAILRRAMHAETEPLQLHPELIRRLEHTTRQPRRFVVPAAAAAAVCLAAVGLVAVTDQHAPPAGVATATTAFAGALPWPARGPFAAQATVLPDAAAAWDTATGQTHRHVALLFAGAVATSEFVVVQGQDAAGAPRIAALSTASTGGGQTGNNTTDGPLYLRGEADLPGPTVAGIVFATAYMGTGTDQRAPGGKVIAFALGAPPATDVVLHSSAVDDQMIEGKLGRRNHQFDWATFPPQSLPDNVTASIWLAGDKQPDVPLTFAGVSDGKRQQAVLHQHGGAVTATLSNGGTPPVGALVVNSAGLIGRIVATGGNSRVQLVSDPQFRANGETAISNLDGTLQGLGGGRLELDVKQAADQINPTNRVLYLGDHTITIGYVTNVDGSTAILRPAAPFADGEKVIVVSNN